MWKIQGIRFTTILVYTAIPFLGLLFTMASRVIAFNKGMQRLKLEIDLNSEIVKFLNETDAYWFVYMFVVLSANTAFQCYWWHKRPNRKTPVIKKK